MRQPSAADLMTMQVRAKLPPGVDGWGYSLKGLMGMVVVSGCLIILIYFLLQRTVVPKVCAAFRLDSVCTSLTRTSVVFATESAVYHPWMCL